MLLPTLVPDLRQFMLHWLMRAYTKKTFEQYNYYDLSTLPAGAYSLVLMIGNEVVEAKLVVVQR